MDLNARANVNVARVDVNFQTVTVTLFCCNSFFILIPINIRSYLYSMQNFSQVYLATLKKET